MGTLFSTIQLPEIHFKLDKGLPYDSGYTPEDIHFVLRHFAKAANLGYIDTLGAIRTNTAEALIDQLQHALDHGSDTVVMGNVYAWTKRPENFEMVDMLALFLNVAYNSNSPEAMPRKILFPITIISADKEVHNAVGAIDCDKVTGKLHFTVLEQHAGRQSSKLDFSAECEAIGQRIAAHLSQPSASFTRNHHAFSPDACGITSLETIKHIALSKQPAYAFATNVYELELSHDDLIAAHTANQTLAKKAHQGINTAPERSPVRVSK